jgi:hypothetical protein
MMHRCGSKLPDGRDAGIGPVGTGLPCDGGLDGARPGKRPSPHGDGRVSESSNCSLTMNGCSPGGHAFCSEGGEASRERGAK